MRPSRVLVKTADYTIGELDGALWIECHACGARSYNTNDVRNVYCATCHRFLLR